MSTSVSDNQKIEIFVSKCWNFVLPITQTFALMKCYLVKKNLNTIESLNYYRTQLAESRELLNKRNLMAIGNFISNSPLNFSPFNLLLYEEWKIIIENSIFFEYQFSRKKKEMKIEIIISVIKNRLDVKSQNWFEE